MALLVQLALSVAWVAAAQLAHAAKPASARPDPMAGVRTWPAGAPVAVRITVYPRNGDVGRSSGVATAYRPQMRFHGAQEVSCELTLPGGQDARIEPGATGDARITCSEAFKTHPASPSFQMLEGGRVVGEGRVAQP